MFEVLQASILIQSIGYIIGNDVAYRATLVTLAICILLAIKCLFFRSKKQDLGKDGIVLENSSGKLIISKESLENLVASVAKEIPGAEAVSSRTILDKDKNLKVFVTTMVSRDMMLKDVSSDLQNKIKQAMKDTADLEVKEVNIKVKNITNKKVKKSKEVKEPVEQSAITENAVEEEEIITQENIENEGKQQEGDE